MCLRGCCLAAQRLARLVRVRNVFSRRSCRRSIFFAAVLLPATTSSFRASRTALATLRSTDRRSFFGDSLPSKVSQAALNALALANVLLQTLNMLGVIVAGAQWVCLAGLLILLFLSVSLLVILIFVRPSAAA